MRLVLHVQFLRPELYVYVLLNLVLYYTGDEGGMAKFGHLQEFDTDLEPITAYLERVELYFSANGIGEDKKLAILLSVIGPKTYGVLRNLLAPSRPQEKKFSEVTEVLIRHFEPKLIVIAERFSFYRRSQLVGESVADFVAELRRLARNCQFGDFLDEALRDRLAFINYQEQGFLIQESNALIVDEEIILQRAYSSGITLVVLGEADVEVQYKGQPLKLRLIVVKGDGPSLMGREWIRRIEIDWKTLCRDSRLAIHQVPSQVLGSPVESLIQRYSDLFRNDLGKMRHFKATLKLLPDVQPKFHRPRPVPFALKEAVERELDRLEEAGVIEKVTHCEWAAPVVVVPKKNGTVRLCGDYKVSINQALMVDQIDANGIHATGEKLDAVLMAPVPSSVPQPRSFLGMINYYSKFIPNLATLLNPLNELLRKDVQWKWTDQREQAFKQAKQCLTSPNVLVHYDPTLPIKLAGDASAYGIGAVISHTLPDGSERPIAFASRTLNASERNYAQLEKEALSLIFGVKKFHEYLYGRRFTLLTDHKPLTTILGPKTGVPPLATARLQRWALLLSAYEYDLEFRPTAQHANADGLSRLPSLYHIADAGTATSDSDVFNVGQIEALPVTAMQLRKVTRQDPILSKVVTDFYKEWLAKYSS
eukprot:Em0002g254a